MTWILRISTLIGLTLSAGLAQSGPALNPLNEGIRLFQQARYPEASEAFRKAVDADPGNVTARLYLGQSYVSQYVPGADSPENRVNADNAEREFRAVLGIQPRNRAALEYLASLAHNRAMVREFPEKLRRLDAAQERYQALLAEYPDTKMAHFNLGVIAWSKFHPALIEARQKLGMKPEDPGPLADANARVALRAEHGRGVDEGMRHLEEALRLDPRFSDAMAYLNLLYRERADLYDTAEEYRREVEIADAFVQKAVAAKRTQAGGDGAGGGNMATAPVPKQIRVGGNVQAAKLVRKPEPAYPPLATQARIQGVVRFTAVIGKDGRVTNLTLVSGHPLLVPSATGAVKGSVYQPTLLNGEPVEVVTQVDVPFVMREGQ